jgi:hypothetical protein
MDLGGAPLLRPNRRRLWIVAADKSLEISDRHQYVFVDPELGHPLFRASDLFLLRSTSGSFTLFAPSTARLPPFDIEILRKDIASIIARACTQPGARGPVHDLLVLSSKPGRTHGPTVASQHERDFARTQLETVVFRLAMMPWRRGEPGTLAALAQSISPQAHPLLPSLFRREHADAAAARFVQTSDDDYAREAIASYERAERLFEAIGMYHQSRATRHNATLFREPPLPGFKPAKPAKPTAIGFSAFRLCGFSISLDSRPVANTSLEVAACSYACLGEVRLCDQTLLNALGGLPSPRQRLVATATRQGDEITISTGLFDEMQALLGVGLDAPEHEDVTVIRIACDSVDFADTPWIFKPLSQAVFVGQATGRRRRHHFEIEAIMRRGSGLRLNFVFDVNSSEPQYFN